MTKSTRGITKLTRPPAPGTPVMVRLQPDLLALLDEFAEEIGGVTRPEALRRAFLAWAAAHGRSNPWPRLAEPELTINVPRGVLEVIDDELGGVSHQLRVEAIELILAQWLQQKVAEKK